MYNRTSTLVLRWLKVPPEPHAPIGDPASLRVFRAGKNYFNLRLFGWGLGQAFAFAGIIFWMVLFIEIEHAVYERRLAHQAPVSPVDTKSFDDYVKRIGAAEDVDAAAAAKPTAGAPAARTSKHARIKGWAGYKQIGVELALWLPLWAFPLLWALKITGILLYLVQIPLTYAIMRLDYEMRWYVVTDRSLRIRTGVWQVQELTMSFANLQQVVITRGPIQGLLGLSDLKVQSAGGSDRGPGKHGQQDSLHTGHFHGVDNATEIRDLIQDRLRRFRESGLGDPEELRRALPPGPAREIPAGPAAEVLAAARELASEAKALRQALG